MNNVKELRFLLASCVSCTLQIQVIDKTTFFLINVFQLMNIKEMIELEIASIELMLFGNDHYLVEIVEAFFSFWNTQNQLVCHKKITSILSQRDN